MRTQTGKPFYADQSILFVLLFLLITALLLIVITQFRQLDFVNNQQRLMSAMTRSTANEISLLVDKYRDAVTLFAEDHTDLLLELMEDPGNEDLIESLHTRVKRHFPDSFGVSLATPDGDVLLDDFDGIVGEVCVQDLKEFADTRHPYQIFVHPHAEVYHFDMPVMVGLQGIDLAVFFVSFRLDEIARLLLNGAPPEHDFMLVNAQDPELIEVTEEGSRAILGEAIRLDQQSRERIGFQQSVEGTGWTLLDFPSDNLFGSHLFGLYRQSVLTYLLVLMGSFFVLKKFRKEERIRQQAEELLVEKNEALTASYEQLQQTQDRLVEAEKMASLGGLVAGIAHEVNTPIGIAVTAISTLKEQSEITLQRLHENTLKKSEFEHFLEVSHSAGTLTESNLSRAAELIKSFKQVAVDQSSEKSRCFRLCDYAREIVISLQPRLNETGHSLEIKCHENVEISSYPGAISQILTNLVINSLQHAFTGDTAGKIQIVISLQQDTAILDYQDNGRGISEDEKTRIFEPFYTTARNKGGSGLGLSIVYNLVVQLLGGQIEVKDTAGEGFHTIIKIPVISTGEKQANK